MISEEIIEKIKEQNDIVDVISESVKLKKVGRNFVGLCPFHNEKTPSFSVTQEKQIYKCFGCGEAGNVITFVMKNRNMTFVEAVKYLGDKVNIEINDDDKDKSVYKNDKIYKINVDAARYFFSNLQNNKKISSYFTNRGILNKTIRNFGLGYAKDDWHGLMNYLKDKGYSELDLIKAGLIIKGRNNSLYDRFRNRVIFPVFDYRGRVIGFGGRVLDDSKPKYLNSPETDVFKKGINLYGLNFSIKNNNNNKDRTIIIVEGYMDCISLHQYGITNVVASLGTALTREQARLLKRYADKILIAYDSDLAGQSATIRGLEILKKEGFNLKVILIPEGKDPDEFIRNNGRESFHKLIDNAMPFVDYKLKMAKENLNIKNKDMLIKYIERCCLIVSKLDPIEKDIYIRKISEDTGVKEQSIYDMISQNNHKSGKRSENVYTKDTFGQKLYLEPAYIKAERNLLKMMIYNMESYQYILQRIEEEDLVLNSHKKIFSLIKEYIVKNIDNIINHIELKCDDIESSKEWINIQQCDVICGEDFKELIDDWIIEIKKFKLEESKKEIMNRIKYCEARGQFEESLNLVKTLEMVQEQIMEINACGRR